MAYHTKRIVQFRDTDAGGIMHFSAYFGWMEEAEHEALRSVGLSAMDANYGIGWPRVSAQCEFYGPVRFEDEVDVEVAVDRIGQKSVTYIVRVECQGRPIAEGRMTAVCCRLSENGQIESVAIPSEVRQKLERI